VIVRALRVVEGAGRRALAPAPVLRVRVALAALRVRLGVLGQVVRPHEPLVAGRAGEPFLSCVGSKVSLQLVGSCKSLAAEKPVADERPFSCVPSQMGFQVGGFTVHLATARDVAIVKVLFPNMSSCRTEALSLLAVGAITDRASSVSTLRSGGQRRGGLSCGRQAEL